MKSKRARSLETDSAFFVKADKETGTGLPLDASAKTPREIWDDFFSKRQPKPEVVSQLILSLHEERKYEHVIAAIEAALKSGQSQPWMYDVLALTLELAGRPKSEVERALLSRVDFTATDVPSMLYSAAYLTRFGGRKQALRLYRQVSTLDPTRPEPYILGLPLARELKDHDGIRWASAGILISAWGKDHEQLHLKAEDAAVEATNELRKAGRAMDADAFERAIQEAKRRDLVIELTWSGEADLDLSVDEPAGTRCGADNPLSRGGGVLLRDGYGPEQKNCHEEYVCALGVSGAYRVRVRRVDGNVVGNRAQLTIRRAFGSSEESTQVFTLPISRVDTTLLVLLPEGRRAELKPEGTHPNAGAAGGQQQGKASDPHINGNLQRESAVVGVLQRFGASRERAALLSGDPRALRRAVTAQQTGFQTISGGPSAARAGFPVATGIGPGVGPGAVGYTPIVTNISDGVSLGALAVVSGDRRYVRLSLNPTFSAISDVFTFTFLSAPGVGGPPTGN